jgi:hypothetical protein
MAQSRAPLALRAPQEITLTDQDVPLVNQILLTVKHAQLKTALVRRAMHPTN